MSDVSLPEEPLHTRVASRRPVPALLRTLRIDLPNAAVGIGAFVVIGGISGADGGYFPTIWGWAGMSLAWLAATTLTIRSRVSFSGWGLVLLGGLAALLAWTFLSALWSTSVTRTMLEGERTLVYVSGALALLSVLRRGSTGALLGGTLAGIVAACAYGLGTRLTPERFDLSETVAAYRLAQPVGYWNGLGVLTAIGVLLALGFAARGRTTLVRALAGATLPMLTTTIYLTFSRGAWVALAIGVVAAIAYDPRRLQLLLTIGAVTLPSVGAVWLASRAPSFTDITAPDVDAVRDGHRQGVVILVTTGLSALLVVGSAQLERRRRLSVATEKLLARALVLLLIAGMVGTTARFGAPWTIAGSVKEAFLAPPAEADRNLNERLFNLSGSGRNLQWRVAVDAFAERPLAGGGAGTYEYEWLQRRTVPGKVRDAHSLYLETLAELGVVGLGLLAVALLAPLLAVARARGRRLAPFALAAYLALLFHAAVDWDWELPAVMLAGLAAGAVLVRASESRESREGSRLRWPLAGLAAALGALSFAGLLGNAALADSREAARDDRWAASAAHARDAARWAPWSSEPWRRAGLAQASAKAARPFLLRAVAKEPRNWELRLELAWASSGRARANALRQATALNPLSPEIAEYRRLLDEERRAAKGAKG